MGKVTPIPESCSIVSRVERRVFGETGTGRHQRGGGSCERVSRNGSESGPGAGRRRSSGGSSGRVPQWI